MYLDTILVVFFLTGGIFFSFLSPQAGLRFIFFSMPWGAISVSIGTTITVSELIALIFVFVNTLFRSNKSIISKWIIFIGIFVLISSFVGVVNLLNGVTYKLNEGSFFQKEYGRILTQTIKWVTWILFLHAVYNVRHSIDSKEIVKTVIFSVLVLSLLGILQIITYNTTGVDIFPIGGEGGRTALLGENIRVTSFAGEPKGFASKIIIALMSIFCLRKWLNISKFYLIIIMLSYAICLIMTGSSSGYFTFLFAIVVMYFSLIANITIRNNFAFLMTQGIFLSVGILYFTLPHYVDILSLPVYRDVDGIFDAIKYQTIERIRLDDTDAVYVSYFLENPSSVVFGLGLGLGYTEAMGFVPLHQQYYMFDTVIPAKSGFVEILVSSGLVGLFIFAFAISKPIKIIKDRKYISARTKINLQTYGFCLVAISALRMYDMFLILSLIAILSIYEREVQKF